MAGALERSKGNVLTRWRRGLLGGFLAFLVFNLLVIYVTPKFLGEPLDAALAMTVFHVGFTAADVIRFL